MWLEDDDIFGGKPEKKFFDIVFNANRNLVRNELNSSVRKIAALELLLEEMLGEMLGENKDIDTIINNYLFNNQDKIDQRVDNIYIEMMGNVLTQNE